MRSFHYTRSTLIQYIESRLEWIIIFSCERPSYISPSVDYDNYFQKNLDNKKFITEFVVNMSEIVSIFKDGLSLKIKKIHIHLSFIATRSL